MSAQSSQTSTQDRPPALPYDLRDHKKKIAIVWGLIILDSVIAPLILFYPIAYASDLEWHYCKNLRGVLLEECYVC